MAPIRHLSTLLFLVILGLVLGGCAGITKYTGKWTVNEQALKTFQSATLLPNHTYYYTGSPVQPDAIIAIDNAFKLRTEVWSEVDISQEQLDKWMFWAKTDLSMRCPYKGGIIVLPDGRQAGIWFSRYTFNTVRLVEPGILQVYLPYAPSMSPCGRLDRFDAR